MSKQNPYNPITEPASHRHFEDRQDIKSVNNLSEREKKEPQEVELSEEWERLKSSLEPREWTATESLHFYIMFCYGWHARKGEASFQNKITKHP